MYRVKEKKSKLNLKKINQKQLMIKLTRSKNHPDATPFPSCSILRENQRFLTLSLLRPSIT